MQIRTYTGKIFNLANPDPEQVDIRVIAHSLARINRFNGHTDRGYSVGLHSLLVCDLAPSWLKLPALFHDAAETYTGDLMTPWKDLLQDFREYERKIEIAICEHVGIDYNLIKSDEIKRLDLIAYMTECRDLMGYIPKGDKFNGLQCAEITIYPVDEDLVETMFLKRFHELTR